VICPIDGKVFTQAAHSSKEDVALAVDKAHEAFQTWGKTSATERSILLNKIAQVIEDNLEYLATVETIDNGKAIRETMAADIPLAVDHFRYFASVIRAEESSIAELDSQTVTIALSEPLGDCADYSLNQY
jgi:aldehyde dehydrogenase